MRRLQDRISFNRFPADKEYLCELLNQAANWNDDIHILLYLEPSMYDRIYFVMSEKELMTLAKRRGDLGIVDAFSDGDALISYLAHCIILYIPAMARKLAQIELRPGDPDVRILFTIHLFACLFHEIGHACHRSRVVVEHMWSPEKAPVITVEDEEKAAVKHEAQMMKRFHAFLEYKGLTWPEIADQLLLWDKLGPVVLRERG